MGAQFPHCMWRCPAGVWVRGKLTEDEYKACQSCERFFGWRDDKYLPTEEQIELMVKYTYVSCDTLRSMYNKLTEEVQS